MWPPPATVSDQWILTYVWWTNVLLPLACFGESPCVCSCKLDLFPRFSFLCGGQGMVRCAEFIRIFFFNTLPPTLRTHSVRIIDTIISTQLVCLYMLKVKFRCKGHVPWWRVLNPLSSPPWKNVSKKGCVCVWRGWGYGGGVALVVLGYSRIGRMALITRSRQFVG